MSNFPTSFDNLTNPAGSDGTAAKGHASIHTAENEAIMELEAKVGLNGSPDQNSHDFKLSEVQGADKAQSKGERAQPNGYAPLDLSGKVPQQYLGSSTPPSAPVAQGDVKNPTAGSSTVYDAVNNKIVTTMADGSKWEYRTDGIYTLDPNGNILSFTPLTGTYATGIMTYTNGDYVSAATGQYFVASSNVAYLNKVNNFTASQLFVADSSFKGRVSNNYFKTTGFTGGTFVYDAINGNLQGLAFAGTSAITWNMKNMLPGVYVLSIIKTGGSAVLNMPAGGSKATCGISMTNSLPDTSAANTLTAMYNWSGSNWPTTLANGVHKFTIEVDETAGHIWYLGSGASF